MVFGWLDGVVVNSKSQLVVLIAPVVLIIVVAVVIMLGTGSTGTADKAPVAGLPDNAVKENVMTNTVGIRMRLMPAGSFVMGRASSSEAVGADVQGCTNAAGAGCVGAVDELPVRTVQIAPFYLGQTEVTQAQWVAVMGSNPSRFMDPRRPVDQVSWLQAQEFIQKLNRMERTNKYRLPSEAEWEYAARAGSRGAYSFGNDKNMLPQYAWFGASGGIGTAPAGKKAANLWGLYDVHGNVWEWVEDCWHPDYNGAPADGRVWQGGDCNAHVVRGGGWNSAAEYTRSATRGSYAPDMNDNGTGFRLARLP